MGVRATRARRVLAAALALVAAAGITAVSGCADRSVRGDGGMEIVTGFYPLAWLAKRIAGPDASVRNLTKPGAEPHDLELTPRQVVDVARADLALYIRGVQPAVDQAVDQQAKGRSMDAAAVVRRLPAEGHKHEAGEEHPAGDAEADKDAHAGGAGLPYDPHIWLDPSRFAAVAGALGERLAKADPGHAAAYRSRARTTIGELNALDGEFRRGLARCGQTTIVTGHESFGYLADRYKLQQIGVTGIDPHAEPSQRHLAELTALVRDKGVTTIFLETNASAKTAKVLAAETGVKTATLNPVEGLPPGSRDDYLSVMRQDLATLRTALDCR